MIMSPLIKFGFQLFSNSRRRSARLRGTLKLVAQFSGSVAMTLGMFGNWTDLIWSSMIAISRRGALLRIRSHNFFEMPVALTREQFWLDCDPWARQFLATTKTQTGGGVLASSSKCKSWRMSHGWLRNQSVNSATLPI